MVEGNDEQVKKALVALAIEQTLLEFGPQLLEKVSNKLFEYYHCYIPDCHAKPEYLSRVLKELFGNSHGIIVQSIGRRLEDMSAQDSIKNFLAKISE